MKVLWPLAAEKNILSASLAAVLLQLVLGCGGADQTLQLGVMNQDQHTHYHVHALDASHEHSHSQIVGGHTHTHSHSHMVDGHAM